MTCASCAARVQKQLNRLDGVAASVNYATETASITFDPAAVAPERLVEAVEQAGYGAACPPRPDGRSRRPRGRPGSPAPSPVPGVGGAHGARGAAVDDPGPPVRRLAVGGPGAGDPGRPLGRVAVPPGRVGERAPRRRDHGHAGLAGVARRLRLVGVGAGLARRGRPGCGCGSSGCPTAAPTRTSSTSRSRALVTAFLLAGRWSEARAKRRAARPCGRCWSWARRRLGAGRRRRGAPRPGRDVAVGDRFVVRPGEKMATDGVSSRGASAIDASLLTGESVPVEVGPGRRRRRRRPSTPAGACRARHPRRRRHGARPDRAAGRRRRRPARRPSSGSPTASSAVFVPAVLALAVVDARGLAGRTGDGRRARSPRPSPC